MKIYLTLLFLSIGLNSLAQHVFEKIKYKGDSVWVFPYKIKKLELEIPPIGDQLPDGEFIVYMSDVKRDKKAAFFTSKNGLKNGPASFYDPKGNLIAKGDFKDDFKEGLWNLYFLKKVKVSRYRYGGTPSFYTQQFNDVEARYDHNTKAFGYYNYRNKSKRKFIARDVVYFFSPKLNKSRTFAANDKAYNHKSRTELYYSKGLLEGSFKLFNEKEKMLVTEGQFSQDTMIGEWKHYKDHKLWLTYRLDPELRDVQAYKTYYTETGLKDIAVLYDDRKRIIAKEDYFKSGDLYSRVPYDTLLREHGHEYATASNGDSIRSIEWVHGFSLNSKRWNRGILSSLKQVHWENDSLMIRTSSNWDTTKNRIETKFEQEYKFQKKSEICETFSGSYVKFKEIEFEKVFLKRKRERVIVDTLINSMPEEPFYSIEKSYVDGRLVKSKLSTEDSVQILRDGHRYITKNNNYSAHGKINGHLVSLTKETDIEEYVDWLEKLYPVLREHLDNRHPYIELDTKPYNGPLTGSYKSNIQAPNGDIISITPLSNWPESTRYKGYSINLRPASCDQDLEYVNGSAKGNLLEVDIDSESLVSLGLKGDRNYAEALRKYKKAYIDEINIIRGSYNNGRLEGKFVLQREYQKRTLLKKNKAFVPKYNAYQGILGPQGYVEQRNYKGELLSKSYWTENTFSYVIFKEFANDTLSVENGKLNGVTQLSAYGRTSDLIKKYTDLSFAKYNLPNARVHFKNSQLNGKYSSLYPSEEANYKDNILQGNHMVYYDPMKTQVKAKISHESIDSASHFKHTEEAGNIEYYYKNGIKSRAGRKIPQFISYRNRDEFKVGISKDVSRYGEWFFYNEAGAKIKSVMYDTSSKTHIEESDSKLEQKRGVRAGEINEWYDNGTKKSEGTVIRELYNVLCNDEEDPIEQVVRYRNFWLKDGTQTVVNDTGYVNLYHATGHLYAVGKIKDGLRDGFWEFYDPNGRLNETGSYVAGEKNGRWLLGDLQGIKYLEGACYASEEDFKMALEDMKRVVDIKVFNYKNGNLISKSKFNLISNRK